MAEDNKYYWLKLKRDFFKRHDIRIIEEMPNGKDYVLFYLKMLLESIDHGGELRFNETIPYNEQMLAVITHTNIDLVRSAMKVFIQLKMIEVLDNETIFMTEVHKMTGSETNWAQKKRLYRGKEPEDKERTLSLQSPIDVRQEIELEKEIDTDTDTDTEIEQEGVPGADAPAPSSKKPAKHKQNPKKNTAADLSAEAVDRFEIFWSAYPKKVAKPTAQKAFKKLNPNVSLMKIILEAIKNQKISIQWTTDNGQYIPNPSTWLNNRRWEDKMPEVSNGKSGDQLPGTAGKDKPGDRFSHLSNQI
jgi:predicted phage replisome organizer